MRQAAAAELDAQGGVLHATAVWRAPDGALRTFAIDTSTPASALDAKFLGLMRARADAILTSGRNLRAEPELRHSGVDADSSTARFRREVMRRDGPPLSAVWTRGAGVDLAHPLFSAPHRPLLLVPEPVPTDLATRAAQSGVPVESPPEPGLRGAVAHLRRERGCRTVLIETGPSTSHVLYDDPCVVDELLLSLFLGAPRAEASFAGDFLSADRVRALFGQPIEEEERVEESGPWRFARYRRGAGQSRSTSRASSGAVMSEARIG